MIARDHGVVFELDAASITTSYQAPATVTADQYASRVQRRRFSLVGTLVGGTAITGAKLKMQASRDGVTWYDVVSVDDGTGSSAVEHTYSPVSTSITGSLYTDGGFPFLRIAAKATGGAGTTAESFAISALDAVIAPTITSAMLADDSVVEAKIADGAVATAKLADAAVETAKLADDNVTAAKLDDAALRFSAFTGKSGTGACTLTGAAVGDVVLGVVNLTDGGNASSSFESTITVVNQIQQSSASDLSTKKFSVLLLKRG
jgi:hypothetical protein